MKILVPVKRVIDPYAKVKPLPDGSGIDTTGIKFEINPFDEIAVEEAVRLRERSGDVEIIVVSIGTGETEEQLRKALAMGADRAILVETDQTYDSLGIATELAELAKELLPDIVLMGKQATDDDCNQAGQMLAAKLDWPQATFASKVEITGSTCIVERETDSGTEILSLPLPCLITADLRLNEPRYIGLPGIIKARSKPLQKRAPLSSSAPRVTTTHYELPPPREPGRVLGSVSELISILKDRGAL